jgi:hypothetical protein
MKESNSNNDEVITQSNIENTDIEKTNSRLSISLEEDKLPPLLTYEKFPEYSKYITLSKDEKDIAWSRVRVIIENLKEKGINPFCL